MFFWGLWIRSLFNLIRLEFWHNLKKLLIWVKQSEKNFLLILGSDHIYSIYVFAVPESEPKAHLTLSLQDSDIPSKNPKFGLRIQKKNFSLISGSDHIYCMFFRSLNFFESKSKGYLTPSRQDSVITLKKHIRNTFFLGYDRILTWWGSKTRKTYSKHGQTSRSERKFFFWICNSNFGFFEFIAES